MFPFMLFFVLDKVVYCYLDKGLLILNSSIYRAPASDRVCCQDAGKPLNFSYLVLLPLYCSFSKSQPFTIEREKLKKRSELTIGY